MRIRACTPLVFSALIVIPFLASAQQATRAAQQGTERVPRSPASLRLEQYLD